MWPGGGVGWCRTTSNRHAPHPPLRRRTATRAAARARARPAGDGGAARAVGQLSVAARKRRAAADGGGHHRAAPPRSEEHTSELQSLMRSSYAVFCLKKKKT